MSVKDRSPISVSSLRRMSSAQFNKLTKKQLSTVLKDVINSTDVKEKNDSVTRLEFEEILENTLIRHLNPIQEKITSLLEQHKLLEQKCDNLQAEVDRLKKEKVESSKELVNEMEQRMNKCLNVIFSGIHEESEGSPKERKDKDREKVIEILSALDIEPSAFVSLTRVGKIDSSNHRKIKVTIKDFETRMSILHNTSKLRRSHKFKDVYINPDLTLAQSKELYALRQERNEKRKAGLDVVIYRNKVVERKDIKDFQRRF